MLFLYSCGIRIYGAMVWLISPFHTKAKQWIRGRKNQFSQIQNHITEWNDSPKIMIHAASYGEYEMAKPIISALEKTNPQLKFVISFYSPSGYENVNFSDPKFLKIYLPLDTVNNQQKLIEIIRPKAVLFIKYEYWYNLLRVLSGEILLSIKTPYYYTSANIPESSYLWNNISYPFLRLVKQGKLWCHNSRNMAFLKDQGFENLNLLGDTRIDKVKENKANHNKEVLFEGSQKKSIIFGSLCPEEVVMATKYINENPEHNYAIAPHDLDESFITEIENRLNKPTIRITRSTGQHNTETTVIINTLGELKYFYKGFSVAYVGGGFTKGPHNLLEPMVYGTKIICGPNIKKYPLAQDLDNNGLLLIMQKQSDLSRIVSKALNLNDIDYNTSAETYIADNKSQLVLLINELNSLLN